MSLCPATCPISVPPTTPQHCLPDLRFHDISKLVLMHCNTEPLSLGTTDSDGTIVLPVSTPAAICADVNSLIASNELFVTPPINDYSIGDASFTNVPIGCNDTYGVEGERQITFVSRANYKGTPVSGATAPLWSASNFWNQISKNNSWVVYGVLLCNGDLLPFFKNGQYARPKLVVSEATEVQGNSTIMITRATITFNKGYDNFTQPQINVVECGGAAALWV